MTNVPDAPDVSEPHAASLDAGQAQRAAELADKRASAYGRILALLSASPRHSGLSLRELNHFLTPALALGQFAMVGAPPQQGPSVAAAVAWWAFVSPEVDERLTNSTSPFLHLEANDWRSGDQPWIVEAAGDPKMLSELFKILAERTFKDKSAKLRAAMQDGRIAVGRLEAKKEA